MTSSTTAAESNASAPGSSPAASFPIIGFSKPFQDLNFEATSDVVAEIGWDGIECPVRPRGQIEPERAADELPELIAALGKRGKEVSIVTTAITSVTDPHVESLLRTCSKLGLRRYRLGFWYYRRDRPIPEQLDEIAGRLRDLAALNKELGLQAGFQNHSGRDNVGASVWDVWTAIKDLDPRHMGLCFDIGHATIEGGTSWPTQARLVQDRLTAVFVKDFTWQKTERGWQPAWTQLGEGMVHANFFQWLKTASFRGPISQHHEYDHGKGPAMIAKMRADLEVLRKWLA